MEIKNSEFRIQNFKSIFSFFILNSAFCILYSCAPKEENPPPPDLISKTEMTSLITDLSISEAALTGEPLATFNDTLRKVNVLKEHNITKEHFLSSFKYYTENPAVLKEIYDSVLVKIQKKR